jgi:LemA protein
MYFILTIIAIFILWIILIYNGLVHLRNQTQEAWSDIDVQLKRRHDLIPNLVATVKAYQSHEAQVMQNVTELRQQATQVDSIEDKAKAEKALNMGLGKLLAVAENYPDLKASANFIELQQQLGNLEEQIQLASRYYNGCTRDYNTKIQSFPNNFIANNFHFLPKDFFQINIEEKSVPKVDFS